MTAPFTRRRYQMNVIRITPRMIDEAEKRVPIVERDYRGRQARMHARIGACLKIIIEESAPGLKLSPTEMTIYQKMLRKSLTERRRQRTIARNKKKRLAEQKKLEVDESPVIILPPPNPLSFQFDPPSRIVRDTAQKMADERRDEDLPDP